MHWRVNKSKQNQEGPLYLEVKEWHRQSFPFYISMAFSLRTVPSLNYVGVTKTPIENLQFFWLKEPEAECGQLQRVKRGRRTPGR